MVFMSKHEVEEKKRQIHADLCENVVRCTDCKFYSIMNGCNSDDYSICADCDSRLEVESKKCDCDNGYRILPFGECKESHYNFWFNALETRDVY